MAITVQYDAPISTYGQAGYLAGRGAYDRDERRYADQQALAQQQLAQREQLARMEVDAAQKARLDQFAANSFLQAQSGQNRLQSQLLGQWGDERNRLFDFQSGLVNRAQAGDIQSALARQQAELQARRDAAGFQQDLLGEQFQAELQRQRDQQQLQGRLEFAQREQERQHAAIDAEAQRRIEAIRSQVGTTLRPADAERQIARILDEAGALKAGGEFPTGSLGPTPKEQLAQQWSDTTLELPGGPVYQDADGNWQVVRGWQQPEDPIAKKAENDQKIQQEKVKADAARAKAVLDTYKTLISVTRDDGLGNKTPVFPPDVAMRMAHDAVGQAWDSLSIGGADEYTPQGPLPGGGVVGNPAMRDVNAAGTDPAYPQQPRPAGPPPLEPNAPPEPVAQQREPITSFASLAQIGQAPPDLSPAELKGIGLTADPRVLPPESAPTYGQLRESFVRLGDRPETTWQRRSLSIVMGLVAAYGPDPRRWPVEVRQQTAAEAAEVTRLLQGSRPNARAG